MPALPLPHGTQHSDYISDCALQAKEQALVVTSGDATLSIHDLRKRCVAEAHKPSQPTVDHPWLARCDGHSPRSLRSAPGAVAA